MMVLAAVEITLSSFASPLNAGRRATVLIVLVVSAGMSVSVVMATPLERSPSSLRSRFHNIIILCTVA